MNKNKTTESDHDILIEVRTIVTLLSSHFNNHLKHHWAVTIAALSAAVMGLVSFITGLIMFLISK